jgi:hypothetical protein
MSTSGGWRVVNEHMGCFIALGRIDNSPAHDLRVTQLSARVPEWFLPGLMGGGASRSLGLGRQADDGPRTRDLRLGKPMLYQLSYVRVGETLAPGEPVAEPGKA